MMLATSMGTKGMRTTSTVIASAALFILAAPAQAAPVAYACDFIDSSGQFHLFRDVDQLLIDLEAQSVELRVAKTMETSEPIHWVFKTRSSTLGDDTFAVKDGGNLMTGAGIYGNAAHSFFLSADGKLTWLFLADSEPTWFRWNCRN